MVDLPELPPQTLISLLSSRLCHDIISPVGAISNAVELLEEAIDDQEVLDLIRFSAEQACAKLQYARLAYGAGGSVAERVSINQLKPTIENCLANEKLQLLWPEEDYLLTKAEAKLLLNLLSIVSASISRGGSIKVNIVQQQGNHFNIEAKGSMVKIMPKFAALQKGSLTADEIDAYSVQAYYTLFLAKEMKRKVRAETLEDRVVFITEDTP